MHTRALPDNTPLERIHHQKPNLHNIYAWGREVYVKIKQGDKLEPQAKDARWIGYSVKSDSHCIYWPDSKKVSFERNILFNRESKPSKALLVSTKTNQLSISTKIKKKNQMQLSVALAPIAWNALNKESEIQRSIEVSSENELDKLQPTQIDQSGLKEVEPLRKSERICLQREKLTSQGPVTRSQARKQGGNQLTSLAFKDLEITPIKLSEYNSTHPTVNTIENYQCGANF